MNLPHPSKNFLKDIVACYAGSSLNSLERFFIIGHFWWSFPIMFIAHPSTHCLFNYHLPSFIIVYPSFIVVYHRCLSLIHRFYQFILHLSWWFPGDSHCATPQHGHLARPPAVFDSRTRQTPQRWPGWLKLQGLPLGGWDNIAVPSIYRLRIS